MRIKVGRDNKIRHLLKNKLIEIIGAKFKQKHVVNKTSFIAAAK